MAEKDLEGMIEYLKVQIPKYLEDELKGVEFELDFEYTIGVEGDEELYGRGDVYRVSLVSGRIVFAVDGGFYEQSGKGQSVKNVYGQELPDAKTASKVHLYTLIAMRSPGFKEKFAEGIGLSRKYRRTD